MKKITFKNLMGFIEEYLKTGDNYYNERIKDETYNELVRRADRMVVKKLEREYNKTYNNFNL